MSQGLVRTESADSSSEVSSRWRRASFPSGMINVTDYASDLLVLREFYLSGFLLGAYVGTGFVALIVAAWALLLPGNFQFEPS